MPHFKFREATFSSLSLVVIGAAILLVIAGTLYFVQQERQRKAINEQTSSTNKLIQEVKSLTEQNKSLNEQNRDYAYCNAVLLAKYTQDQQPIVIEDLNKCIFKSFPDSEGPTEQTQSNAQSFLAPQNSSNQVATQQPQQQPSAPTQPAQPATPATPATPANPAPIHITPIAPALNPVCSALSPVLRICQ